MSLNILLDGYAFPYQTPTTITLEAIGAGGAGAEEQDLRTLDFLHRWAHACFDPPPLRGKDARNPFLRAARDEEVMRITETFEKIRTYLENQRPYIERKFSVI